MGHRAWPERKEVERLSERKGGRELQARRSRFRLVNAPAQPQGGSAF